MSIFARGPIQRAIESIRNGAWKQGWGSPQSSRLAAQGLEDVLTLLQTERAAIRGNLVPNSHFEVFPNGFSSAPLGWSAPLFGDNPVRDPSNISGGNEIKFRGSVLSPAVGPSVVSATLKSDRFAIEVDTLYEAGAVLSAVGGTFGTFSMVVDFFADANTATSLGSSTPVTVLVATAGYQRVSNTIFPDTVSPLARYAEVRLVWAGNFLDNTFVDNVFMRPFEYQFAATEARSTTTSTIFQSKTLMITAPLRGTFRVGWTAIVDGQNTRNQEYRLQNITDVVTVDGPYFIRSATDGDRRSVGGFQEVSFTGAAKTFDIQFRNTLGAFTAGIQQARIELWRIP